MEERLEAVFLVRTKESLYLKLDTQKAMVQSSDKAIDKWEERGRIGQP